MKIGIQRRLHAQYFSLPGHHDKAWIPTSVGMGLLIELHYFAIDYTQFHFAMYDYA
jgi:hypothetical protein